MSSSVAPTLEPVCIAKIGVFIMADDGAPLIDSGGKDAGVRVENNVENKRSDGRATGRTIHQNSLPCRVNSVSSDHGPKIVAGDETPGSADVDDSAVGPSN